MANFYLSLADIPGWLKGLSKDQTVFTPRREGGVVVYRPYEEDVPVEMTLRPTESAKHVVFPRSEELFTFERQRNSETEGGGRVLSLKEAADPGKTVIFGALPCDARGFLAFDPVYDGSGTGGKAKDTYYLKRRSQTTVVAKACKDVLTTCFCNWVGGSPQSTEAVDVLATPIEGGLFLEALTEKGQALVGGLGPASAEHEQEARAVHKSTETMLPAIPDGLDTVRPAILARFDDVAFWHAQSDRCLSCGACSYLCPTCYCFNITDQSNGISGVRLRSWDNCMSALFTLEASGHNPRTGKAMRLKNRVGHKFSYYPDLHEDHFSCVGCGRCIKSCPSGVDIRQIVLAAAADYAGPKAEKGAEKVAEKPEEKPAAKPAEKSVEAPVVAKVVEALAAVVPKAEPEAAPNPNQASEKIVVKVQKAAPVATPAAPKGKNNAKKNAKMKKEGANGR